MKFLCDVHISFKIVSFLNQAGHEAIHVNNILSGCFTPDKTIMEHADENDLILITKDSDFQNMFHLMGKPKKLIKVSLGNIATSELIDSLAKNLDDVLTLSKLPSFFIEIGKTNVTVIVPQ
jgi:predicted nuclease of predicted toxin-antitoxin system